MSVVCIEKLLELCFQQDMRQDSSAALLYSRFPKTRVAIFNAAFKPMVVCSGSRNISIRPLVVSLQSWQAAWNPSSQTGPSSPRPWHETKGLSGAFLSIDHLQPQTFVSENFLPHLYFLLFNFGVMPLVCPGVGKRPLSSLWPWQRAGSVHCFGLSGVEPGWRRAKSLDNLWHKTLAV